jgi:hypothetical protein
MKSSVSRQTVNLDPYPDLVVIYLGMKVRSLRGPRTLISFGPRIFKSLTPKPEGLLLHEGLTWSFFPLHVGFRQYWRDFDSLETWVRSLPHQAWWQEFLRNPGGTGFWHETYFMRGGMEAIYDDMGSPFGFGAFAGLQPAKGPMFTARQRLRLKGESTLPPAVPES